MFFKKLVVILYKNLLLRRTQWLVTSLEVILPLFFVWLLCSVALLGHGCGRNAPGYIEDIGNFELEEPHWCNSLKISYAPDNTETKEAVDKLNQGCGGFMSLRGFGSEALLLKGLQDDEEIGIVFPDGLAPLQGKVSTGQVVNSVISYKIRMNAGSYNLPSTKNVLPTPKLGNIDYARIGPNYYHGFYYQKSKFLSLQLAMDKVLAGMTTGKNFNFKVDLEGFSRYIYPGTGIYQNIWMEERDYYGQITKHLRSPKESLSVQRGLLTGALGTGSGIAPLLCLSLLFSIPTITRNVASEKQTGIAELLKSAGVSGLIQWLGWMINSMVPMLFTVSICTLFLFIQLQSRDKGECQQEAVLVKSAFSLVWLMFLLYIWSTIAMCFFICSVIKRPTLATTVGVMLCVVSTVLPLAPLHQIALSIFPNCAMSFAFKRICSFEDIVLDDTELPFGAQWEWEAINYRFPSQSEGNTSATLMELIGMLIADIVVYSLLALYLENVLPSEFGVRRPWYWFHFGELFARRSRRVPLHVQSTTPASNQVAPENSVPQESVVDVNMSFEPEGMRDTPVGIEIQNIYKNFGKKYAVVGVNLKMYKGDIFALLGHNGAGKTTLISMITGFFSPTRGTAIVEGHDVKISMEKARKHMGLCPQHNMLFDNISVKNQLIIFGMLRGKSCKEAKSEGDDLLFKMNLFDKKTTLAKNLSGGQKRKLSLAMALIGGTKVVVLDEPTSGMDPQARREIWDILLNLREGRTILLTTHFMEEADVLGDRIGIMAAGKIQCCGTTAFLKKFYGTGFTLKLTLKQKSQVPSDTSVATNANATEAFKNPSNTRILALVKKHIPIASVKRDARSDANSSEMFLTLPAETATTAALTGMFTDLNGNKSGLGIQTIGLQQTTMDEVFIRVGEIAEEENGPIQKYEWTEDDSKQIHKLKGLKKAVAQFFALLRKKWLQMTAKWITLLLEVLVTLLLVLGGILVFKNGAEALANGEGLFEGSLRLQASPSEPGPQPELPISLNSYETPIFFYYTNDPTMESHIKKVLGSSNMKYTQKNPEAPPFKASLALEGKSDMSKYKRRMIIAVKSDSPSSITAMFNAYPYHAAPLALNTATNIALRDMNPTANNQIRVINHPSSMGPQKQRGAEISFFRKILQPFGPKIQTRLT